MTLTIPPQKNPLLEASGTLRREWFLYLQAIPGKISEVIRMGTWAELQAIPAGDVQDGTLFVVTDRGALYQSRSSHRLSNWVLITGELRGLYAARPADLGLYDAGFLFTATDRTVTWRWSGSAWAYESGTMRGLLAELPTLSAGDAGFPYFATDYRHLYRWDGTAWDYADADPSGRFAAFTEDPGPGWQLCDGATGVVRSKADGTTDTIDLPDLTAGAYLKGGAAYTGTVNPATGAASLSGNTGNAAAGLTTDIGAGQAVQSGAGVTVAAHTHAHNDPTHHHDLSGATVGLTGDLVSNLAVMICFRL